MPRTYSSNDHFFNYRVGPGASLASPHVHELLHAPQLVKSRDAEARANMQDSVREDGATSESLYLELERSNQQLQELATELEAQTEELQATTMDLEERAAELQDV
ncbi:MAG: hypothetical protein ABI446_01885, partial [Gemmatimonadaceae bacterium]